MADTEVWKTDNHKMSVEKKGGRYNVHSHFTTFFCDIPVVDSTGSEVCVEDSDDGRCCVSQNGIIDDIQEVNQL